MIRYKVNITEEIRKAGYSQPRIKKEGLISGQSLTRMVQGKTSISLDTLGKMCDITGLRIEDIIENVKEEKEEK